MDKSKYAEVLAGFEAVSIDIAAYRIPLEEAQHNLSVCRRCRATEISWVDDKAYHIADCPLHTYGYYYALSESATRNAGKPVFAYHNCGGPAKRLQEIANRLGRRKEA